MAARKQAKNDSVFQLKVTLRDIEPAVWRRLLVESDVTLGELHFIVNQAMGWTCSHMHSFVVGKRTFSDPTLDPESEIKFEDDREVTLASLAAVLDEFSYRYDPGDGWEHEILVEKALAEDQRLTYPLCIGGARACPPEDCGGPPGYGQLLEVLADEKNPAHDDMLTWVGGYFDPEGFDVNRTNSALTEMYGCAGCDDCDCDSAEHAH